MEQLIEFTIDADGAVIDCQAEPFCVGEEIAFNVTLLYPSSINGFGRSEIYCHLMKRSGSVFSFDCSDTPIHPKIEKLEKHISNVLCKSV